MLDLGMPGSDWFQCFHSDTTTCGSCVCGALVGFVLHPVWLFFACTVHVYTLRYTCA